MASLLIDDQDAAVYTVSQVAAMLQVTQAFLRPRVLALEDRISQPEARLDARAESARLRTELATARAGHD
jgi:hypothetical protein